MDTIDLAWWEQVLNTANAAWGLAIAVGTVVAGLAYKFLWPIMFSWWKGEHKAVEKPYEVKARYMSHLKKVDDEWTYTPTIRFTFCWRREGKVIIEREQFGYMSGQVALGKGAAISIKGLPIELDSNVKTFNDEDVYAVINDVEYYRITHIAFRDSRGNYWKVPQTDIDKAKVQISKQFISNVEQEDRISKTEPQFYCYGMSTAFVPESWHGRKATELQLNMWLLNSSKVKLTKVVATKNDAEGKQLTTEIESKDLPVAMDIRKTRHGLIVFEIDDSFLDWTGLYIFAENNRGCIVDAESLEKVKEGYRKHKAEEIPDPSPFD